MSFKAYSYKFCPVCGQALQKTIIDHQLRDTCPQCSFIHWGEFSIGAGGVLWHEGKVLLVQRAQNPGKGSWTIPGGYVNKEEPLGEAISREIREETGIQAQPVSLIAVRDRPGDKHDIYLIFLMEYSGGALKAQVDEVSNVGFFSEDELAKLNIAQLTISALNASKLAGKNQGLTFDSGVELLGALSTLYQIS